MAEERKTMFLVTDGWGNWPDDEEIVVGVLTSREQLEAYKRAHPSVLPGRYEEIEVLDDPEVFPEARGQEGGVSE